MTKARELSEFSVVEMLLNRDASHEVMAGLHGCKAQTVRDVRHGKRFASIRADLPRWTGKKKRARPTEAQIVGVLTAYDLNLSQAGRKFDMSYATVRQIRYGEIYRDVRPDVPRWEKGGEAPQGAKVAEIVPLQREHAVTCVHYEQPRELPWPFCEDLAPRNCCALEIPDACPAGCAAFLERTPCNNE